MIHNRRRVLRGLAAGAALGLLPLPPRAVAAAQPLPDYPFRLGVASGFPTEGSVVLWTRLAPEPAQSDGAMPPVDWPLRYEVAEDERFGRIVARGEALAEAGFAHSVHVQPAGLRPARDYWFRFIAGGHVSAVGRTRTLPAARDAVAQLRLAVASCQHYERGHYAAWRHVAAAAPDASVHVGDYIYEGAPEAGKLRLHNGPRCYTVADYRLRYAQYQCDPALQAAHLTAPWFVTWDDHEVANDYSGDTPGRTEDPARFLARRAAAYQAWYEHMPVPPSMAPRDGRMRIHAHAALGQLATLHMLDQRQYRSSQACPQPPRLGGLRVGDACTARLDPSRSMLGMEQEAWLEQGLAAQPARWTLLAQGTVFAHMDQGEGGNAEYWSDGWTGYPAARSRLLESLAKTRSGNPVVLSGDIHAFTVAGINAVPERLDTPLVAAEFGVTSISTDAIAQDTLDRWRAANANVHRLDGTRRGYLLLTLSDRQLRADLVGVDDPALPDSGVRVSASYVLEAGDPRIKPA
ncbi:MAG TPA: alkaline phosphatase D family protein [Steroidobacteraceae bacterium]|nr:alkaline phosphatase D family protein [Steroidobacteraceae bacterium]